MYGSIADRFSLSIAKPLRKIIEKEKKRHREEKRKKKEKTNCCCSQIALSSAKKKHLVKREFRMGFWALMTETK